MIIPAISRRAEELAAEGASFVIATVVRAQRPTSVEAGNVALVRDDGTIEGFVGGVCTEHSVRAYSLAAMQSGEAVLLRILPFAEDGETVSAPEDGAVTVQEAQCLGYCDRAPCLQVDAEETRGPMSLEAADALLDELRATPRPDRLWR